MFILDNFVEMQHHSHKEGAQEGAVREERMGPGHPFSVYLLPSVLANVTISIIICVPSLTETTASPSLSLGAMAA